MLTALVLALAGCEGPLHHSNPLLSDEQVTSDIDMAGTYRLYAGQPDESPMYLRLWPDEEKGYFIEGYANGNDGEVGSTMHFPAWLRIGYRDNGALLGEIRHDESQGSMYLPMPMEPEEGRFRIWPLVIMSDFSEQKSEAEVQGFSLKSNGQLVSEQGVSHFLELVDALAKGEEGWILDSASFDFEHAVASHRRGYLQRLDAKWYQAKKKEGDLPGRDSVMAVQYLAEQHDDPWAHYAMARLYGNGAYFEKSEEMSRYHAEKALALGENKAYGILGYQAQYGLGVGIDIDKASEYYRLAAEAGDPNATRNLAFLMLNGDEGLQRALALLQKAAQSGDPWAAQELGRRYQHGDGVAASLSRAFDFYRQAADWGLEDSGYYVGWALENGEGVDKDIEDAIPYYRRAAAQQHIDAQVALGRLYWNGEGVEKSVASSIRWFREAAEQGSVFAMSWLGHALSSSSGEQRDDVKAVEWFKKAAEAGDAFSMWRYGVHLGEGRGIERNFEKAIHWLVKAEEEGQPKAREDRERITRAMAEAIRENERRKQEREQVARERLARITGPNEDQIAAAELRNLRLRNRFLIAMLGLKNTDISVHGIDLDRCVMTAGEQMAYCRYKLDARLGNKELGGIADMVNAGFMLKGYYWSSFVLTNGRWEVDQQYERCRLTETNIRCTYRVN